MIWRPAQPGELLVTDRHEARIVRFDIGVGVALVPVQVGRGTTNIRPVRAEIEYRAGAVHRVVIEGRVIRKSDGQEGGRGLQMWAWSARNGRETWPPTDPKTPPLAWQLVRIADGGWDEIPAAADGALPGYPQQPTPEKS
jgi:hypothetical protein